jgi:hypothetical protein
VKSCRELAKQTHSYTIGQDRENERRSARRVQEIIWREQRVETLRSLSDFNPRKHCSFVERILVQEVLQNSPNSECRIILGR